MEPLTQSSPSLCTPSSENDKYFGYYRGTITIYPCHALASRENLLRHIRTWLDDEIGTRPPGFRRISLGGHTVWELHAPRESGVEVVRREIPSSWYGVPEKEEKAKAMNLGGLALVVAEKIVGGSRDARTAGLIAVSDGPGRELLVPMSRYRKAAPTLTQIENLQWFRLHSANVDLVDWGRCLLSLQESGLVGREKCAVWGPEQRSEPWATRRGAMEHGWRIIFVRLYDELLKAVEGFRMGLPGGEDKRDDGASVKIEEEVNEENERKLDERVKGEEDGKMEM